MYSAAAPGRLADGFPSGCGVSQGCSDAQPRRPHTLLGFYLGGCATMSHLCLFLVLPGQGQLSHWARAAWRAARAVWSLPLVRSPGEVWPAPAPRGPAGLQAAWSASEPAHAAQLGRTAPGGGPGKRRPGRSSQAAFCEEETQPASELRLPFWSEPNNLARFGRIPVRLATTPITHSDNIAAVPSFLRCVCVCYLLIRVWLFDPVDGNPPGSSVPAVLQARILEWVTIPFSRGSSRPKDRTHGSFISGRFFTT